MTVSPKGREFYFFFLWQIVSTILPHSLHPAVFPHHFSKLKLFFFFFMPHLLHPPIKLQAPQNTQPAVLPERNDSPYPDCVQVFFPLLSTPSCSRNHCFAGRRGKENLFHVAKSDLNFLLHRVAHSFAAKYTKTLKRDFALQLYQKQLFC